MICPACRSDNGDDALRCVACGASLALEAGAVLAGRYEVKALLGRGGMGAVYRAHDRVVDEDVALKVLAEADPATEPVRRWQSEIRLARQVTHENVCRIHDCGEDGARRWISMELVDGRTVRELLRSGPLVPERAWDVALQAADGLAAVHRAGVVHRDLKTLNLTVDGSSRVRVMDFGIATPAASGDAGERGYLLGSPEYISPEQARGRPADARSDVYALGVVVFELFTGRVPFRADTPVGTLLLHLEAAPPLDDERVPRSLRPVLARALAKRPEERFGDAGALVEALREARRESEASSGGKAQRPERTGRHAAIGVALAAVVVGAAIVALARWPSPTAAPAPDPPAPVAPSASASADGPHPEIGPAREAGTPPGERAGSSADPVSALSTPTRPQASAPDPVEVPRTAVGEEAGGVAAEPRGQALPPVRAEHEAVAPEERPPDSGGREARSPEPAPPRGEPATPDPTRLPRETVEPAPAAAEGALLVLVRPWADVSVDGVPIGQTPLAAIPLAPGPHQILLTHPDYHPYPRRVVVRSGETARLEVDLTVDAVRRPD